ncbi:MAG: hypothetical protein NTZ41_07385 [Sphingobacteriales bacterium]|nr:hypothetical protein [Sphingobacteriales bacterium]
MLLRSSITKFWEETDWNWSKLGKGELSWQWSPKFSLNVGMIVFVMAASSIKYSLQLSVYKKEWAQGGNSINRKSYFGYTLPLGFPMAAHCFLKSILFTNPFVWINKNWLHHNS